MNPTHPSAPSVRAHGIRSFDRARPLSAAAWQFEWQFATDDRAFDGHFPQQPVLAGVFLVEMSQHAAEFALMQTGHGQRRVTRVERFRFFRTVVPGDVCTLIVEWPANLEGAGPVPVTVAFSSAGEKVAHGHLVLAAAPAAKEPTHAG